MKRAQIKLFESIAMLLVFFFLVAMGLKFYGNIEIQNLKQMQGQFSTMNSIKTAIVLSNLPEIKCSVENIQGGACVDLYKIQAWDNEAEEDPALSYYFDLLGYSTVHLEQLMPMPRNFTMHKKVPEGNYSTSMTPLPVSVWDPVTNRKGFGILYVRVHSLES
ncbi:MAG: hypothetical protein ACOCWQ_01545 [Nanoarchaeota archaeon]